MYLIYCWSYLIHSLHFVGGKKKKSQFDYFPKSFSPSVKSNHRLSHTADLSLSTSIPTRQYLSEPHQTDPKSAPQ